MAMSTLNWNLAVVTGAARRPLETVLWVIGIACVAAFAISKIQVARAQTAAIHELEAQWLERPSGAPDQSLWSAKRIADYAALQIENSMPMPLGILTIPDVDVRVAVFNGNSERVLNMGAGRVPGTGEFGAAGNLAIAGHRDGFFRGLKDIAIGDDINLQHGDGIVNYSVTEIFVVDPDAVHVLEPTEEATLTLITCYPFYFVGHAPQRFIVKAVAEST